MLQRETLTPNSAIAQQILKEHSGKNPDRFSSLRDLFGWHRWKLALALAEIQAKTGVVIVGLERPETVRSMMVGTFLQRVADVESNRTMSM